MAAARAFRPRSDTGPLYPFQNLSPCNGAGVATVATIRSIDEPPIDADTMTTGHVRECQAHMRRLILARITICGGDVDTAADHERPAFAGGTGLRADATEHDQRSGDDRAR